MYSKLSFKKYTQLTAIVCFTTTKIKKQMIDNGSFSNLFIDV